jgi:hypothetical protein
MPNRVHQGLKSQATSILEAALSPTQYVILGASEGSRERTLRSHRRLNTPATLVRSLSVSAVQDVAGSGIGLTVGASRNAPTFVRQKRFARKAQLISQRPPKGFKREASPRQNGARSVRQRSQCVQKPYW